MANIESIKQAVEHGSISQGVLETALKLNKKESESPNIGNFIERTKNVSIENNESTGKYSIKKLVEKGDIGAEEVSIALNKDIEELNGVDLSTIKVNGDEYGMLMSMADYDSLKHDEPIVLKKPPGIRIYYEDMEMLNDLEADELAFVMRALFSYYDTGEDINTDNRTVRMVFKTIKNKIDKEAKSYTDICRKNSINAKKGHIKRTLER